MLRTRPHPVTVVLVVALVAAIAWRIARETGDDDDRRPLVAEDDAGPDAGGGETEFAPRDYDRGDCVTWDQEDGYQVTEVVPCEELHLVEVVGRSDLEPGERPYPDEAAWGELHTTHCEPLVERYLDGQLDPYGRLGTFFIRPTAQGWADGDRQVWCAISMFDLADPTGDHVTPFAGRAADVDQARVDPIGTCLVTGTLLQVDCAGPHHYEVVAVLDAADLDQRPTDDVLFDRCPPVPEGTQAPAGGELDVTFIGLEQESWDAGSRRGTCAVAAYGPDDEPVEQRGRMVPPSD